MANFMGQYLDWCDQFNPKGEYLVYGERRCTWHELNLRVNRLASGLLDQGIQPGDKVILMFHNCPEFFETNYAIQRIGAIPVPMNYRFTGREIAYQTNHCEAVAYIFEDIWLKQVLAAQPELSTVKHFIVRGKKQKGMLSYENIMNRYSANAPQIDTTPDDTAVICYTGGTTGLPKGVMLTYQNHISLLNSMVTGVLPSLSTISLPEEFRESIDLPNWLLNAIESKFTKTLLASKALQKGLGWAAKKLIGSKLSIRLAARHSMKIMMPSFPLFHDAAYQLCITGPITGNQTLICPTDISFNPEQVLALVEREKPQLLGNVPTGWKMLLKHPKIGQYDLSSVKVAATGAGVAPASLKQKIFDQLPGVVIADVFGQTEMTPATTMRLDLSPATLKDRCIGKPFVETRIVDDNNNPLPAGEIGEIIYRSGSVMKGYYNEPDKTAEAIQQGWLHSGDLGYFDEDGDLIIKERKKECISSGGEKIFPHEVEEVILEHDKVKDVCVIGVADETWGQTIRAVILCDENNTLSEKDIINWCTDKVAGYKKPRSVIFVHDFPVTAVGKVQRGKIRELYGKATEAQESAT
ncbi:MAG: AMP-dependent synthetase [Gammaproteobacteria bacterium]|nr:MAG: AMP-dependent synthetase [Gammaproteobacteria bacterium]